MLCVVCCVHATKHVASNAASADSQNENGDCCPAVLSMRSVVLSLVGRRKKMKAKGRDGKCSTDHPASYHLYLAYTYGGDY